MRFLGENSIEVAMYSEVSISYGLYFALLTAYVAVMRSYGLASCESGGRRKVSC